MFLGDLGSLRRGEERPDEGAQKPFQPAQEEGEVVAGGGEHGIDAVALAPFEIIASHAVLGFDMADDRLDCGAPLHLTADRGSDATGLAGDPRLPPARAAFFALAGSARVGF